MAEPRTEWGKELKAETESLQHDFAGLKAEVSSLTETLHECHTAVRGLLQDVGEFRQSQQQLTDRVDQVNNKFSHMSRSVERAQIQLSWIKWILGLGASGLIAVGIFITSTLVQLSVGNAKLESTLQKLHEQLEKQKN